MASGNRCDQLRIFVRSQSFGLNAVQPREDSDFQHASQLLDGFAKLVDLPCAVSAITLSFASFDVFLGKKGRERRIDNGEALVGEQGTRLLELRVAELRIRRAKALEGLDNFGGSDRSDFNWNCFPVGEES